MINPLHDVFFQKMNILSHKPGDVILEYNRTLAEQKTPDMDSWLKSAKIFSDTSCLKSLQKSLISSALHCCWQECLISRSKMSFNQFLTHLVPYPDRDCHKTQINYIIKIKDYVVLVISVMVNITQVYKPVRQSDKYPTSNYISNSNRQEIVSNKIHYSKLIKICRT